MASFLDIAFAFKGRERPPVQALFRQENYLEQEEFMCDLPTLRRSCMVIQHAFNILSVEKPSKLGDSWPLRQTALYHSFDANYGRSLWIVLKGNTSMRKRIPMAMSGQTDMKPAAMASSPQGSFVASLSVHLVVLEWCAENWGDYIDDLEEKRVSSAVGARIAPVVQMTSPQHIAQSFAQKGSTYNKGLEPDTLHNHQRRAPLVSTLSSGRKGSDFKRSILDFYRRERKVRIETENSVLKKEVVESGVDQEGLNDLDLKFSFDEFQRLSFLEDEVELVITAIEQNKKVLNEIQEHYMAVLGTPIFQGLAIPNSKTSTFFRKLRSIVRELELHLVRLESLSRAVATDKIIVCLFVRLVVLICLFVSANDLCCLIVRYSLSV